MHAAIWQSMPPVNFFNPSLEVWQSDQHLLLFLNQPGINPQNTSVSVEGRTVVVDAKPQTLLPADAVPQSLYSMVQDFRKRTTVSAEWDLDHLEAKMQDGQLLIRIPRSNSYRRSVPIQ